MTKAERVILDILRRQKSAMTRDDIVAIAQTMYKGGRSQLCNTLVHLVASETVEMEREYTYRIKEADHTENT